MSHNPHGAGVERLGELEQEGGSSTMDLLPSLAVGSNNLGMTEKHCVVHSLKGTAVVADSAVAAALVGIDKNSAHEFDLDDHCNRAVGCVSCPHSDGMTMCYDRNAVGVGSVDQYRLGVKSVH